MQVWGEPCIFTFKRDGSFLLAIVWIETSTCVDKFIGLKIARGRDARTRTLSQELYIEKIADRFLPNKTQRKLTATNACLVHRQSPA
eukprot:1256868-Pleurochrysis_carterae.AAC.1